MGSFFGPEFQKHYKDALFPPGKCNDQSHLEVRGTGVTRQCRLDDGHSGKHWCPAATYDSLIGGLPIPRGEVPVSLPEQFWENDGEVLVGPKWLLVGVDR